jgi:hypothetical protein
MESATETVAPAERGEGRLSVITRLARGELSSVRVLIVIAVIWTIFQLQNDRFSPPST